MDERWTPLHINWINDVWNYGKRVFICSWKGHDYYQPYCFRCWKQSWTEI